MASGTFSFGELGKVLPASPKEKVSYNKQVGVSSSGVENAFVRQRCSGKARSGFAGPLQACAPFSHIFSVPFIEQPMTKAVLVVHTKGRGYSSL